MIKKNLEKLCREGNIFCCVRFSRRKCFFHIRGFFFPTSYFPSERDLGAVKIVSHILKSLLYEYLVKILSSDKRQSHTGYTFSLCMVITDSKLTPTSCVYQYFSKSEHKTRCFHLKNTISIHFNDASIISIKVKYSVIFQKYFTFRHSLFSLILSAKR